MPFVTPTPSNPFFATAIAAIEAGNATDFRANLNNRIAGLDSKAMLLAALCELLTDTLGNGAISGGTITAGVGLSVSVAALSAFVGNYLISDASETVGGLASNNFNRLWLRQDGTWTVNQSDTPPSAADGHGEALKWGIVQTDLGNVTEIDNNRALFGGRFLRSEISVITLSDADYAMDVYEANARVLEFHGALTADRSATIPDPPIYGEWIIYNNTTGGHNVTVRPFLSGIGVAVAPGKRALIYYDSDIPDMVRVTPDT